MRAQLPGTGRQRRTQEASQNRSHAVHQVRHMHGQLQVRSGENYLKVFEKQVWRKNFLQKVFFSINKK
jgi:hypothetical protein